MLCDVINLDSDEEDVKPFKNDVRVNNLNGDGNGNAQFYAKRSRHNNVIGSWKRCNLKNLVPNCRPDELKYIVTFISNGKDAEVAEYELALDKIPMDDNMQEIPDDEDIRKIGTRIIAKRRSDDLPYFIDDRFRKIKLFENLDSEFYPGIIARNYGNDICVFFDDGVVQFVRRENIRRVMGNHQYENAHWNARTYFEFYGNNIQYEVEPTINASLNIELNGKLQKANVQKIDRILILVHFQKADRFEWIYVGSPRISHIYRELIKRKTLDKYIDIKTYKPCRSADVVMIDLIDDNSNPSNQSAVASTSSANGVAIDLHVCSNDCVRGKEDTAKLERYRKTLRPVMAGWEINSDYYRTPCGIQLQSINAIEDYLEKTESKLLIEWFDLDKKVIIQDISRGLEKVEIPVCGHEMTSTERSFNYVLDYNFDYVDVELQSNLGRDGCNCEDNCRNKAKCACWQLTVQRSTKRQLKERDFKQRQHIGYKNKKLEKVVSSGIVECGSKCKCCIDTCVNRIVQHGLQIDLEMFKTKFKGWGVRTKYDLPQSVFVSTYSGDILEAADADRRDSTIYQFKLPVDESSDDSDDEYDYRCRAMPMKPINLEQDYPKRYYVVQYFVNYFPPMSEWNGKNLPASEPFDLIANKFVIDAEVHGNISRFFNHSCDPNLFAQRVFVDDDVRFPKIAFFTRMPIKAGTELTFDYQYDLDDRRKTACHCGADDCRRRLI